MTQGRVITKQVLANIVAFLLFHNMLWTASYIVVHEGTLRYWLLAVPFGLMLFIRIKAANTVGFFVLHVAVAAAAVGLVAARYYRVFVVVFVAGALVYSYLVRAKGEWIAGKGLAATYLLLHLVMFVALETLTPGAEGLQVQLVLTLLLCFGCMVVYTHIDNVDFRLTILRKVDNFGHPIDKVLQFNNKTIAVFGGGMVALGFVGALLPVGTLLTQAVRYVLGPLLRVLRILPDAAVDTTRRVETALGAATEAAGPQPEAAAEAWQEIDEIMGSTQDSILFEQIQAFFDRTALFVLALLVPLTIYLFYRFWKYFYKRKAPAEIDDHTEEVAIPLGGSWLGDLKALLPRRRPRHAVRRAYAKKVNSHIREGVKIIRPHCTTTIMHKILPREDIAELTAQYEAVRYGP